MTKQMLIEGVKLYCQDHNLSVSEFAKRAMIDPEQMQRYCDGTDELSDDDATTIGLHIRMFYIPEPKSCPFCGSEARVRWTRDFETLEPLHFVGCSACGVALFKMNTEQQTINGFETEQQAVTAWNRRVEQ